MTNNFRKTVLATLIASSLSSSYAISAEEKEEESESFAQTVIITGVASGKAIRKVDATFAISNFDAEDMGKINPASTADLFKAIPGIWSESSGGVSGANVFVRGFPGSGDAPFLTVQLQGVPVFPPPTLSFLENSTLFRLDETVSFMEALRGGPNPVVSNGQPGLTTNFLLKEGGEETEGLIKYTVSDYGQQRVDTVVSGEIDEGLYIMLGGYVKSSPGIRDAEFNAEQGSQWTVNITKEFEAGKLNIYTRQTDDHGVWYLPTPLDVPGVDNEYTQIGTNNRQATIQYGPDGTEEAFDFGDGRGWVGAVSGGSLSLDISEDWILVDRFNLTSGDADTYGLVPNGNPVLLSTVADNGIDAIGRVTGNTYAGDTVVQQIGRWVVKKQIKSFTNDLALTKEFGNGELTVGLYNSHFSTNDWWSLGNQAYHVVESGGESLTGIDCNDNQDSCGWNYDINSTGDGTTRAFYVSGKIEATDVLTLEAGLRQENHTIDYTVDEGLDGQITKSVKYDETESSWTLGANYALNDHSGIFARINEGSKMPFFDDFRDNFGRFSDGESLIKEVSQFELGYKLAEENFSLYATAFFNEFKGDSFVPRPGAPAEVSTNEAAGVEVDFSYFNDSGFSVNLNSTIQNTEITAHSVEDFIGNDAQRLPGWQIRATPSYDFDLSGSVFGTLYATLSVVDDRFGDNGNNVTLDGYSKIDLGLAIQATDELGFLIAVNNATDQDGITEGDPRNSESSNGRYILPRTIDFSIKYEF